jgi:hypothetical protein
MKQKLLILFCLTVFCLSAQNKIAELNVGIGQIKYKNSAIMPSGVSGMHYTLDYWQKKDLKLNNNISFGYFAELDFSNLNSWKAYDYTAFKNGLDVGAFWLRHLPVKNEQIKLYAGGGLLFDLDIHYSHYSRYSVSGQWFLSPFVYFLGDYNLEKINFRLRFSMPVFSFGFQSRSLYYPTFFENAKMVLTPNTFAFFTERFYPKVDISASYPVFSNDKIEGRLQLRYSLEQLFYSGFPSERKAVNGVKLGIVWVMK